MDIKHPTILLYSDEEVNRELTEVIIKAGVHDCTDIEMIMSKPFEKTNKKVFTALIKLGAH